MANELQITLDAIKADKDKNLLPDNIKKGITTLGINGALVTNSNLIDMMYATIVKYFIDNYGMQLNDQNQSACFTKIVNKRNGETLDLDYKRYGYFPQNVYGILIKSYDIVTNKVQYKVPLKINMNNNMHNLYTPSTWKIGDMLDFYVSLYTNSWGEHGPENIELPLSFIFKDIEIVYMPTLSSAEMIRLGGTQKMIATSNYAIGDSVKLNVLNVNTKWKIGDTMRVSDLVSQTLIFKDGEVDYEIPQIFNYDAEIPTQFIAGTITNIDSDNKLVTLTITELNTRYIGIVNELFMQKSTYDKKDNWLPSHTINTSNPYVHGVSGSYILFQDCRTDELPDNSTQSYYYDKDNSGKNITRTCVYVDNITGFRNDIDKFSEYVPDVN